MFGVTVDRNSGMAMSRQIYEQIRELIHTGMLDAGGRLPSTRALARELSVSRNVILQSYEQLAAEGYIQGSPGSGTRVAAGARIGERPRAKKGWGKYPNQRHRQDAIDFRTGLPAVEIFPLKAWGRIMHQLCLDAPPSILEYGAPEGLIELRTALGNYLKRIRGIDCRPDQIFIVSGATQGLSLAAELLFAPGAAAVLEDPINPGMKRIFAGKGYVLRPVPVDDRGLRTNDLPAGDGGRLIYVTPSHQFPLGGVLPVQRRIELIRYAAARGAYIIEDDYDSEFRYEGPPLSALQSLAPEHVIYIGSFSKILAPALRCGYVIVPEKLVRGFRLLKLLADVHAPSLDQLTLARFIEERKLERHIAKARRVYAERRAALLEILTDRFPGRHIVLGTAAGMHVAAEFPGIAFNEEIVTRAERAGVIIHPAARYAFHRGVHGRRIVLGYSHLTPEEIAEGLSRLAGVFEET